MDMKDDASHTEDIGLSFGADGTQQFVTFENEETVHLVIHPGGSELEIPSSALEEPSQSNVTVTSNVGQLTSSHASGLEEGPMQTLASVAMEQTLSEEPEDVIEDLYGDSQDKTKQSSTSSLSINQSWFTGKHAKESLQENGHKWRQGMWSKYEVAILMKNIDNYVKTHKLIDPMEMIFQAKKENRKDFYRTIAVGLERPLFAVYRRVQRMYDAKNYVGRYSNEDIEKLKLLRLEFGNDWAQIGAQMGRSASSVKDKCRLLKDACHQGKWSFDEEERLSKSVYEVTKTPHGQSVTGGIPWQQVAEKVHTRTEKQCRAKWLNYLNWKHTGGTEWSKLDEEKLLDKIKSCNVTDEQALPWGDIASGWKSVRSPQWLRSKWWSLKRSVYNYEGYTLPDLVEFLKIMHLKRRLRAERFPSRREIHPPIKIARVEVPQIGNMKNSTLTLHVPLPLHQTGGTTTITTANIPSHGASETLGALDPFSLSQPNVSSSAASLFVQSLTSHDVAAFSGDQIIVSALPEGHLPSNKQHVSVQLHPTSSNQLIITTNHEPSDRHDGIGVPDDLGVRVSLHDAHLGVTSETSPDMTHVDHLTRDIGQSDTDHTDTGEESHLSSQSQLIGTDAVLSQQEVTSSELQVVTEAGMNDSEATLVIVRSVPPSEGLVQSGGGGVDPSHLDNSVFTLSVAGSLLACANDHSDLMDPSADHKLPDSPHS